GRYWTSLVRSSNRARGIWRDYWQGLATLRIKGLRAAKAYLAKASQGRASNAEEQEAGAHSLYLLASNKLSAYKQIKITLGNEAKAVNDKATGLQALEKELNKVIQFGNGTWTIAALYGLGQSYTEFAKFLKESPTPKGLSAADQKAYKQALGQQAAQYSQTAAGYYKQCLSAAEKNFVFTDFVKGCLSRGKKQIDEASQSVVFTRSAATSPRGANALRKQLLEDNKNTNLLNKLSILYIRAKDYATAELIQKRILEIKPDDAEATAKVGIIKMFKKEYSEAHDLLQKAYKANARQPLAVYGLAGLYKNFYFSSQLKRIRPSLSRVKKPGEFMHPFMKQL
ncbi:MAG: hypothetical protein AAF202_13555, partial [Pseudomonadota bacterium]